MSVFFEGPAPYSHPKLRFWAAERDKAPKGRSFVVEILRSRLGFGFGFRTHYYVHELDAQGADVRSSDEMFWDEDLDEEFVEAGFRAITPDNEGLRFGLALRRSFSRAERSFGEGFFNAALVHYLRSSPFAPALAENGTLGLLERRAVDESSAKYAELAEMLEAALSLRARQLVEKLGYDQSEAIKVLARGLTWYLEDRFALLERKLAAFDAPGDGRL